MQKRTLTICILLLYCLALPALAEESACPHQYEWQSDDSACWQQCTLCGNALAKAPHKEFCPSDGLCDVCGHAAPNATVYHAYTEYAGCDDAGHFVQCAGCGNTITEAHYGSCQQEKCAYPGCEYASALQNGLHNVQHAFKSTYSYSETHHWQACENCGYAPNEAPHSFQFSHVVISTCQQVGYNMYKCICGAEKREDYTQLGTHSYEITETPPSCEKAGSRLMVCVFCGDTMVDTFPALSHVWDNYDRHLPTCTQPGMTFYECDLCGDYLEEELPPLTHKDEPVLAGSDIVYACRHCGRIAEGQTASWLLLYSIKPDRYGNVRLKLSDGWTAETYAQCELMLIFADNTSESAPFMLQDDEITFSAPGACTAAFIRK